MERQRKFEIKKIQMISILKLLLRFEFLKLLKYNFQKKVPII